MPPSDDKYDTLEKIGHGSFGVIRKVRRKADGFIMCRKEISYLRMSQKEREQLHAEFQILSHLRHPNIVAYYHREHLKISQDLHLYMEYCGNGDLGRVIKDLQHKGQRAQESFVWSIFSQLVMALYRCHYGVDPPEVGAHVLGLTQGNASGNPKVPAGTMTILHRDLKPENVFLGEDNSVKLGDFGLSKMIKSHDFASTYVGTPFYMSPEICAAEKYTLKSDIWSLGCIIYELCAREPPFNAKSHFQLVQRIKEAKVSPLPDMYSPELNQVIKDCLRVNPDRRPDTAQLLSLPVVKLMRKEKEVVDLNKALKVREEALKRKEQELDDRLASLDRETTAARDDMEASVRREWEVKARLEIDRQANLEIETLKKCFEDEVRAHVEAELQRRRGAALVTEEPAPTTAPTTGPTTTTTTADDFGSSVAKSDYPPSSTGASGDEFPSTTDITDCSLDSPDGSREAKRSTRTPFGRAQTMFAGTPMDIEMASPSPMAIASLSLSPRRNGTTKAPSTHSRNIFAVNSAANGDPRWDLHREPTLTDSDDEDIVPSPTRHIRSSKNPFTSKDRPVLTSQKSCPAHQQHRLRTKASSTGLVSKATGAVVNAAATTATPGGTASHPDHRHRSPGRQLSKIPSVAGLHEASAAGNNCNNNTTNNNNAVGGGLGRKTSVKKDAEALNKMAAKNNIRGRTLVELQQARAGGRPLSVASAENMSPKRAAFRDRPAAAERRVSASSSGSGSNSGSRGGVAVGGEAVAVWDPERDEMPSPFLVRQRRIARA